MDRRTFSSRLIKIEEELPKLANTLSAMKFTDTGTYERNYEELSLDAAKRAEHIACSLRNLIYAANLVSKPLLMEKVVQVQGISISHTTDMVEITLPGLMPKRNKKANTTFLTDPLYSCLEIYTQENQIPHFKECVVCFTQIFNQEYPFRRIRDYDNLECKQLLDTAAEFLMTDDGGLYCDAYHTTELGIRDCTVLTIMKKPYFALWLNAKEDRRKTISDF